MDFKSVGPPWWDKVVIIGGGPSLADVVPSLDLINRSFTVIGVNESAFRLSTPILFSLDHVFIAKNEERILGFKGERYFAVPPGFEFQRKGLPGVHYLYKRRGYGICERNDTIFGLNSGFGALNLASHKQAKEVYLLGFDMQTGEETHWHGGYPWRKNSHKHQQRRGWIQEFHEALPQINRQGMAVFNVETTRGASILDCFPRLLWGQSYQLMINREPVV